jgi:hypothetical protein
LDSDSFCRACAGLGLVHAVSTHIELPWEIIVFGRVGHSSGRQVGGIIGVLGGKPNPICARCLTGQLESEDLPRVLGGPGRFLNDVPRVLGVLSAGKGGKLDKIETRLLG